MKNSLKILIAAGVLLFGSLGAYTAGLRAEYARGTYKDPLRNYNALAFRNFNQVDVLAASALNVKIVAGQFGVHVGKDAAEFVRITQQGPRLSVALAYPEKWKFLGPEDAVIISCPQLLALATDGVYSVAGKMRWEKTGERCEVTVQGFSQDSLTLRQDLASQVRLVGNTLGRLRAVVGATPGSASNLTLEDNNRLAASDLRVAGRGKLVAHNVALPALRWQLGDSARVELSGRSLMKLR